MYCCTKHVPVVLSAGRASCKRQKLQLRTGINPLTYWNCPHTQTQQTLYIVSEIGPRLLKGMKYPLVRSFHSHRGTHNESHTQL